MIKVIFQSSTGEEREIDKVDNTYDAYTEIRRFLDERKFVSHYMRQWQEGDRIKIDVGSHTEFFYFEEDTMEDNRCKDCINNTVNGCSIEKEPGTCGMDMPLPLMMEVGLI